MMIDDIYNKPFEDAAETKPRVNYPLDSIGITNRPHYISILDPFNKKTQIKILAQITVLMNLVAEKRGLHMSRVEKALHELSQSNGLTLEKYSQVLCQDIKKKQGKNTHKCKIALVADYERYSEKNVSGKPSHEIYKIYSEYELNKNLKTFGIGLMADIMNACPCAQRWGMRDFHQFLESKKFTKEEIVEILSKAPLQSHTNRGKVKIFIGSHKISLVEIHNIIEKTAPIVRELLGANDEHAFIKRAHDQGLFCEDLARKLAANTYEACVKRKLDQKTKILITVEMDESIHYHNVYSKIETTFGELGKFFKK